MSSDILVVAAMREETAHFFEQHNVPVLYTGIGKVNATYHLTRALMERQFRNLPTRRVVNVGTAGSRIFQRGTVVMCCDFIQRDMNATALGFAHGQTPFCSSPIVIKMPIATSWPHQGSCASADNFEMTLDASMNYDVVDMEAFALAKVCWFENIEFASLKYITDGADSDAAGDWQSELAQAPEQLWKAFKALF